MHYVATDRKIDVTGGFRQRGLAGMSDVGR